MVTAMKPRQILLSCSSLSTNGKPLSLTADQKPVLLQAVCLFLESNGFSKTLKKFLSEASIEKESWKSCMLNLEDACCMYLTARSQNDAGETKITSDKTSEKIVDTDASIKSNDKKKKKGEKETTDIVEVVESEVALTQEKPSKKAKDKKKKKGAEATPEPLTENLQTPCVEKENKESTDPEKSSKPKSERKKKNKDSKIDNDEVNVDQDKKSSKKRKKSSSEENKIDDLKEESEVIKCRKTCDSGDEGTDKQVTKTVNKDSENELVDNGGDKSALNKSSAKKENGSEPRSKNETFHRVKTDDVEFADDRLKDNSYWAKDGAEIGYGAKAQEVLGQVRGRDFRHEKTKKKRGSYRGGLIDLQSHSVKFNYSEEEDE